MTITLALLLACSGPDDSDGSTPSPTDTTEETGIPPIETGSDTGSTSETGSSTPSTGHTAAPTGSTGHTGLQDTIDCAALSPTPLATGPVPGARAYHGLVITDAGTLIGTDGNNLLEADGYGASTVFRPGTGAMEQLDMLSDGTIVGAKNNGDIVAFYPSGGTAVLASVGGTYGVRVGPDDKIYVAGWSRITRIDPATGAVDLWYDGGSQFDPKVMDFNVDFTKMYVGSINSGGKVYVLDLDANYDPVGNASVFATTPGSWHDGLAVDVCGNVYVAEYNNRAMYRISPGGFVATLFAPSDTSKYGHGLVFGKAVGPFSETALYIPQPYNGDTVAYVEIGVPYRTYTGPVINAP
jgi:hypothetical protein